MFFVVPALLLVVVVSALADAAAERPQLVRLQTLRLRRRDLPRYTPFDHLTDEQQKSIAHFEYFGVVVAACLCRRAKHRARTEPRTAAMIFEDILRDKAEFNDCSEGLYLAINARRQWLQIYRSGIQRKAFFINNYHFRYRLLTEECMCRWRLARLPPTSDEDHEQRQKCAAAARRDLEWTLLIPRWGVKKRAGRHRQQWAPDTPPTAQSLLTLSAAAALPLLPLQHLRQAPAPQHAALSNRISGARHFLFHDVPSEFKRRAAAAERPWSRGSGGSSGAKIVQPIPHFVAVGGR